MNELDILISDRIIELRDKQTIILRPCKVLQLRTILGIINKYVAKIAENEDAIKLAEFLLQENGEQGLNDVFTVLKSCSKINQSETKSSDEFFNNLYYDELFLLVTNFIEMNKDFFARMGKKASQAVNPEPENQKTGENLSAA